MRANARVWADKVVCVAKVIAKLRGFGVELDDTNMQTNKQVNAQTQTREGFVCSNGGRSPPQGHLLRRYLLFHLIKEEEEINNAGKPPDSSYLGK